MPGVKKCPLCSLSNRWILCTFPPRCDVMGKRGWGGPEATGPQYLYSERCHSNTAAFEQDSPSHQLDGHVIHKSSICASLEFAHKCFTEIDTQYNFLLIGFRKKKEKNNCWQVHFIDWVVKIFHSTKGGIEWNRGWWRRSLLDNKLSNA